VVLNLFDFNLVANKKTKHRFRSLHKCKFVQTDHKECYPLKWCKQWLGVRGYIKIRNILIWLIVLAVIFEATLEVTPLVTVMHLMFLRAKLLRSKKIYLKK